MIIERNYIEKVYEEIEAEIREKFPNSIVIALSTLLNNIKSFSNYWLMLETLGVKINLDDNFEMVCNNTVRFTVPSSSEFNILLDDNSIVELAGANMAKLVKNTILHAINNFMIRADSVVIPENLISFRFKENGEHITVEKFDGIMSGINHFNKFVAPAIDKVLDMPKESRDGILKKMKNTKVLNRYGIFFDGDMEAYASMDLNSTDMDEFIQKIDFKISVPSSSIYRFNGNEIAGENVIEFIENVFGDEPFIPPYMIDKKRIIIRDEKWTKDKYDEQDARANNYEELYNSIFG